MTYPLDVDPIRTYQDVYARLVDLCEREAELSDEAHLCVMEAFNDLAEIDRNPPTELPDIFYGQVADVLQTVRRLLIDLSANSSELETALAFGRVRTSICSAIEHQR